MSRVSSRASVALSALALVLGSLAAGCEVDPYCIDCVDRTRDAGSMVDALDAATDAHDAAPPPRDTGLDSPMPDAWMPDGCVPGATELCNNFDDDCDGTIDEDVDTTHDVDHCGSCTNACTYAHAFGTCTASTCSMGACLAGYYDIDHSSANGCEYHCPTMTDETCDRVDNDCDMLIDETFDLQTDSMNCGVCGRVCNLAHATSSCVMGVCSVTSCATGFVDLDYDPTMPQNNLNGCEYRCTATGAEVCDRIDNDCDGTVDEGDPGGGATCGSSVGICSTGTLHCVSGNVTCMGGVSPGVETCNNLDDDCDGVVDDNNPGGGAACGNSTGACIPGRLTCTSGSLMCIGAVGPTTEVCDGIDNDCDGNVDNGDPGGGGACGIATGACTQGVLHCAGATLTCVGGNGPTLEICDTIDNDCNGIVDDGFDLMNDVGNCGTCGHVCSFPNAVAACSTGTCVIAVCAGGFINFDGMSSNGCEFMCTPTGAEVCNGLDDDCDRMVDEGVVAPANFCLPNGVCAGTTPTCSHTTAGFTCNYPSTYQVTETLCDTLDNDCNGIVNDPYPLYHMGCTNGELGTCARSGVYQCNSTNNGLICDAPSGASSATTEVCNGQDDNCNGLVDDGTSARGTWVQIRPSGGTGSTDYWMQAYEASRPDSSSTTQGSLSSLACSESGRLPWTSVTPAEAAAACATVGGTLCSETQWQLACNTLASPVCNWSYATSCTTYSAGVCNGLDYDTDATMAGNQDTLIPTGSRPSCDVTWTVGTASGQIYDLSGNAQEWALPRGANLNPVRGGSYNDISNGLTCGFNFDVEADTVRLPDTGFRCCRTTAP